MRMYDLIMKKRNGGELLEEEIKYMIEGYVTGEIPDYQMSAMLMSIYYKGMNDRETSDLTNAVADSGERVDLSDIDGVKVDKHSTGGVGDKTTLVIGPIASACGIKVAKMSGRGLGHTGGTIDKLESIPGMKTTIDRQEFFENVNRIGISIIGQSGNLAPADKKLYALRDVTATVDSIPLIASSIMSKKLAAGNDCILLDVKTGSGAFMKSLEDSIILAKKMVAIGEQAGKRTIALITNMDIPLGHAIGNSLEVIEAIEVLKGNGPEDLTQVCCSLAANMLYMADRGDYEECMDMVDEAIASGKAFDKFVEMVEAQGGDSSVIKDTSLFPKAPYEKDFMSESEGYIVHIDTEKCGIASVILGAGRKTKEEQIDYGAGIYLNKKTGDFIRAGEKIGILYTGDESAFEEAERVLKTAIIIEKKRAVKEKLIFAKVEKTKVEKY